MATDDTPDGMKNPNGHLLCYPVAPIRGEPKSARQPGVYLSNELGLTRLDVLKPSELCIPAVLAP